MQRGQLRGGQAGTGATAGGGNGPVGFFTHGGLQAGHARCARIRVLHVEQRFWVIKHPGDDFRAGGARRPEGGDCRLARGVKVFATLKNAEQLDAVSGYLSLIDWVPMFYVLEQANV